MSREYFLGFWYVWQVQLQRQTRPFGKRVVANHSLDTRSFEMHAVALQLSEFVVEMMDNV